MIIDLARDFGPFPFGRYRNQGRFSGQAFREDVLEVALNKHPCANITVILDNAKGLGSSFLDEAFGGLARARSWTLSDFLARFSIVSKSDPSLVMEIEHYVREAQE